MQQLAYLVFWRWEYTDDNFVGAYATRELALANLERVRNDPDSWLQDEYGINLYTYDLLTGERVAAENFPRIERDY